jgi:integrase-like protein
MQCERLIIELRAPAHLNLMKEAGIQILHMRSVSSVLTGIFFRFIFALNKKGAIMTSPVPALHPEYTRGYIQRISPRMYPQPSPSLSSRPHISSLANKPKLLDQVRYILRFRHYSYQTEKTYIHWIKRFIFFHHKRHPAEMGKGEVEQFLTSLAVDRHVSAATQNQALHALLFLYREVLTQELG